MEEPYDLIVIGGGAAGFFGAIQCAERNPALRITILEKARDVLSKVRISGGGRCNVTHACFDPKIMVGNYPRGHRELLGPFHRFLCGDMIQWLESHEVQTQTEEDGRIFPATNNSETIIHCFLSQCRKHKISINTSTGVDALYQQDGEWIVVTGNRRLTSPKILVATGSSQSVWNKFEQMGHTIIRPVPSLFTFQIQHPLLSGLAGISVTDVSISAADTKLRQDGPLLITHWGLSGPAILKLSAWGARMAHEKNYKFEILINWVKKEDSDIKSVLNDLRRHSGGKKIVNTPIGNLPKRLWLRMIEVLKLGDLNVADMSSEQIVRLTEMLTACKLKVSGKSTNKDEFVTCGGIDTIEINFKTMESRLFRGLYFAGEILNIDAVTGGFNFQAAWTEAYIAAEAITTKD